MPEVVGRLPRPDLGNMVDVLCRPFVTETHTITSSSTNNGTSGIFKSTSVFNSWAAASLVARKMANQQFVSGVFNVLVSIAASPQHRGALVAVVKRNVGYRVGATSFCAN